MRGLLFGVNGAFRMHLKERIGWERPECRLSSKGRCNVSRSLPLQDAVCKPSSGRRQA